MTRAAISGFLVGVAVVMPLGALGAVESPVIGTVATVSIHDAKIASVNGREISVNFSLYNRTGIQPDVKYGITIVPEANAAALPIDEVLGADTLTIGSGESVVRDITYNAPAYVPAGKYLVWIHAATGNGLPLATALAGKVTFPKSDTGYAVTVPGSCYYQISGNTSRHSFSDTALRPPGTTVTGFCSVQSHFSSAQTLTPHIRVYKENEFGESVSDTALPAFSLGSSETRSFSFTIPVGTDPNTYLASVGVLNTTHTNATSPVSFTYAVEGSSGTILNVTLDKNQYSSGTTAVATISWSGRTTASSSGPFALGVSITGHAGSCGAPVSAEVGPAGFGTNFSLPISGLCQNPSVTVSLKDPHGNLLDQKTVTVASPSQNIPGATLLKQLLFLLITLLVLAGILAILRSVRAKL